MLKGLADDVMSRIGAIMPVTPVPLAATVLLEHQEDRIDRSTWEAGLDGLRRQLQRAGAPVVGAERSSGEILDRALVMFTLRRVVYEVDDGYRIDRAQDPLLRFYASSIAHFFASGINDIRSFIFIDSNPDWFFVS